jgi:hypothetical protein
LLCQLKNIFTDIRIKYHCLIPAGRGYPVIKNGLEIFLTTLFAFIREVFYHVLPKCQLFKGD